MKIYSGASPAATIFMQILAKDTEDGILLSCHPCLFKSNARCETEMRVFLFRNLSLSLFATPWSLKFKSTWKMIQNSFLSENCLSRKKLKEYRWHIPRKTVQSNHFCCLSDGKNFHTRRMGTTFRQAMLFTIMKYMHELSMSIMTMADRTEWTNELISVVKYTIFCPHKRYHIIIVSARKDEN